MPRQDCVTVQNIQPQILQRLQATFKYTIMTMLVKFAGALAATAMMLSPMAYGKRPMENLGRGVVAVRQNETAVLVSWRLTTGTRR